MKKVTFIFSLLSFIFLNSMNAQSVDPKLTKQMEKAMTIDKFLALPNDDFWKYSKPLLYQNQGFEDGHGMYAWPPALKTFPKKVGLLSFMVFDPGFFSAESKKYGGPDISYTVTNYKGAALSLANTKALTDFFYQEALPELKANFASFGSELLAPEEFCSSPDLKNAYLDFNYEEKGSAKWLSGESSANTIAVPEGQRMYYAENFTTPGFLDAIGPKASELGLDAVIVLKIQMGIDDKGTISIQSINYAMYGKNPVPKNPDKKYVAINPATGYHDFVVYDAKKLGAYDLESLFKTEEGMNVVVSVGNKTGILTKLEGVGKLINQLVLGANYELNQWITGGWKPFKYK